MVKGIDTSHWQNKKDTVQNIDYKKAKKEGAEFVFIKVSERGSIDKNFAYSWEAAKDAGLLRGGYHFLRWDMTGARQAKIFCAQLKNDPGELPPVADFEAPRKNRSGLDPLYPSNALLEQFLTESEKILGRKLIIYTSPGYAKAHLKNKHTGFVDDFWKYWDLWIAHYFYNYRPGITKPTVPEPWDDWTFWQYTAVGNGPAYGMESESVDLNWFNGNMQELLAYAKQEPQQPDPTEPPDPQDPPQNAEHDKRITNIENWIKSYSS